jgi:hypothetical protein
MPTSPSSSCTLRARYGLRAGKRGDGTAGQSDAGSEERRLPRYSPITSSKTAWTMILWRYLPPASSYVRQVISVSQV